MGAGLDFDLDITGFAGRLGLATGIPFCSMLSNLLGFLNCGKVAAGMGASSLDLPALVASIEGCEVFVFQIAVPQSLGSSQGRIQAQASPKIILYSGLDDGAELLLCEPVNRVEAIIVGAELAEIGVDVLVTGLLASAEIIQQVVEIPQLHNPQPLLHILGLPALKQRHTVRTHI
ncbi:hypothetical protein CALVIDRAFT_525232 [Calocera viscosa TUFC12733]|uniref:Uncharacterized protein n=1 Tax=Calocera viscosa (strain TUFC12733) TaxID=1330018 RepID=A0A167QE17_CALVF|nr:hypothetical protein CALVIDRAFT_525232 [Calocera viscosa TUFC12733]